MEVAILHFERVDRNTFKGTLDIKVTYGDDRWEIFRGLCLFEKEGRRWLSYPNIKRNDKWLAYYERYPAINKDILPFALNALDSYQNDSPSEVF